MKPKLKIEDTIPLKKMCEHWYLVGMNPQPCPNMPEGEDGPYLCMCCRECQEECDEEETGL